MPNEKLKTAVGVATGLVDMQLRGCRFNLKALSDFGDHFGLGYVFGFHDCACQMSGSGPTLEAMAIFSLSYTELAGEQGPKILQQSMDLANKDRSFQKGLQLGGAEFLAFMRDKVDPFGLYRHVNAKFHR